MRALQGYGLSDRMNTPHFTEIICLFRFRSHYLNILYLDFDNSHLNFDVMLKDEKRRSEHTRDSVIGGSKLAGSSGTESAAPDFQARGRIRNKKRRASQLEPVHRSELHGSFSKHSHPLNRDPNHSISSTSSSPSPPPSTKKTRRRSDAEPDHTLRGRARDTRPIEEKRERERSRSRPPSRHRSGSTDDGEGRVRRQRSLPNIYGDKGRRDSMAEEEESLDEVETETKD